MDEMDERPRNQAVPRTAHPFLKYTLSRVALLLVVMGLLYLIGARGVLLLALGLIVSGLLSFFLLSSQRDQVSGALVNRPRRPRLRDRLDSGAAAEDDEED